MTAEYICTSYKNVLFLLTLIYLSISTMKLMSCFDQNFKQNSNKRSQLRYFSINKRRSIKIKQLDTAINLKAIKLKAPNRN